MMNLDLLEHEAVVTTAADGTFATDLLAKQSFDLVFLDIHMPKVDGFAVLVYMKQLKLVIPTIVLTNGKSTESDERAESLGAKESVMKVNMNEGDLWKLVLKHLPGRFPRTVKA